MAFEALANSAGFPDSEAVTVPQRTQELGQHGFRHIGAEPSPVLGMERSRIVQSHGFLQTKLKQTASQQARTRHSNSHRDSSRPRGRTEKTIQHVYDLAGTGGQREPFLEGFVSIE